MLLLDIMRAIAVFMMIQGHSIDALLSSRYYNFDSWIFQLWQTGRGLTAPIFLFGSGFAYVIANTSKMVDGKMPLSLIIRRVRWIGLLFLIGAFMHFPVYSLGNLDAVSLERWRIFWHVDVLRLMAVTLVGLLGMFLIARNVKHIFILSTLGVVSVVAATPFINSAGLEQTLPEWLSSYLTFKSGSYFPLFPFAAYLYAGAASASVYKMIKAEKPMAVLVNRFAVVGAMLIAGVKLAQAYVFDYASWIYTSPSPLFFIYRLSLVMLMWAAVGLLIRKVEHLPRIIPIIGQHTLFIYVFHVAALYGGFVVPGLRMIYGKELSLYPVLIVISTLLVVCSGMAYVLHDFKHYNIRAYRIVPYAGMLILFFMIFF